MRPKQQFPTDLIIFTEETLSVKLYFLYSVYHKYIRAVPFKFYQTSCTFSKKIPSCTYILFREAISFELMVH